MKYNLSIGNVSFQFEFQINLSVEKNLQPFLAEDIPEPDVKVKIQTNYFDALKEKGIFVGEDLLLEYYSQNNGLLCVGKGGWKGNLSITACDLDFHHLTCYLNLEVFSKNAYSIGNIMRLLPMRMIFQKKRVLFFHASQIAAGGIGILFSAPSGTGKTTQAKLWKNYRDAQMICNDRTLVCKGKTYGCPIDGSEPVISEKVHSLGAVVLLAQGKTNEIQRLKASLALPRMMEQLVFDTWDSHQKEIQIELLLELLEKIPVYLLSCTPDEGAVICLEQQLKKDGVLK